MRLGTHETRLLKFAIQYQGGWHTYGKDQATVRAVKSLRDKGFLVTNDSRQFRLLGGVDANETKVAGQFG